jgi:hypothetical protein
MILLYTREKNGRVLQKLYQGHFSDSFGRCKLFSKILATTNFRFVQGSAKLLIVAQGRLCGHSTTWRGLSPQDPAAHRVPKGLA